MSVMPAVQHVPLGMSNERPCDLQSAINDTFGCGVTALQMPEYLGLACARANIPNSGQAVHCWWLRIVSRFGVFHPVSVPFHAENDGNWWSIDIFTDSH